MRIDYERVVLGLKEYAITRRSHGQGNLLAEIARLEVAHQVPEGQEGFSDLPAYHQLDPESTRASDAVPA